MTAYIYHGKFGLTSHMLECFPRILEEYPYAVEFDEDGTPDSAWLNDHLKVQTYWSESDMVPNHHYEEKGHLYSLYAPFMFVNNIQDYEALLTHANARLVNPFQTILGELSPVKGRVSFWHWIKNPIRRL